VFKVTAGATVSFVNAVVTFHNIGTPLEFVLVIIVFHCRNGESEFSITANPELPVTALHDDQFRNPDVVCSLISVADKLLLNINISSIVPLK
jgi:hypothetical protein